MFIAVARITLSIPNSGSLKSKRHVVHKVVDKVKARFNVSIAEVEDLDLWQKATLGLATVANEHAFAQESVSKVLRFIEELYVAPVLSCSTEVISMGDELYGADDGTSFGSAARGAHRTLAEAEAESDRSLSADWSLAPPGAAPAKTRGGDRKMGKKGGGGQHQHLSEQERERAVDALRTRLREARRRHADSTDDNENDEDF